MTAQSIVLVLGGLLIVIGVIGGGFEIKEIKVPKIGGFSRGLSLIAGIVLIGIGIIIFNQPSPTVEEAESSPTVPTKITVVAGTYGRNCGAPHANKTAHLVSECDGRRSCSYVVDYKIIGDPVPGCAKDYIAEWKCGYDQPVQSASAGAEAGFRSVLNLACE